MRFGTVRKIIGECLHTGAFTRYAAANRRGYAASPWPEELPPPAEAVSCFSGPEARTVKQSQKVEAVLQGAWFCKRYRYRGFTEALKDLFRPPRPEKVLAATQRLTGAGLHLPAVMLAGSEGRWPQIDRILMTEALPPGAEPWDKRSQTLLDETRLDGFIAAAVAALVGMHGCGIAHGDLNLRNLYDVGGELWFIDLDGALFCGGGKGLPRRLREKELARLVSSLFRAWKFFHHDTPPEKRSAVTARFVREYAKLSGMDLGSQTLSRRIEYLTFRVRKDGKDAYIRNVENTER